MARADGFLGLIETLDGFGEPPPNPGRFAAVIQRRREPSRAAIKLTVSWPPKKINARSNLLDALR